MKTGIKILIVFALIASSMKISAQDLFNLKLNFEKGKTYLFRTTTSVEAVQNVNGQDMNINSSSKLKTRLEVTDIVGNKIETIFSLDSMYSKTGNPMGGEDVINNGEGIVGKKTKFIYSNLGKRLNKVEIDKIPVQENMDMSNSGNLFLEMTDNPVKIGDVWNVVSSDTNIVAGDGKMIIKAETECKVDGKETFMGIDCLKISYKNKMKIEGSMTQQGMDIVFDGTGKSNGLCYFDYAKGLIILTDNNSDLNITAVITSINMTIPITQKMKTNVLLLEN